MYCIPEKLPGRHNHSILWAIPLAAGNNNTITNRIKAFNYYPPLIGLIILSHELLLWHS